MGKRSPNPRLAKTHRNYTVGEIAALYNVHKNTVLAWRDAGLSPIADRRKPLVFLGTELSASLKPGARRICARSARPNLLRRLPRRERAGVWRGGIPAPDASLWQSPRSLPDLFAPHLSACFTLEPGGCSGSIERHVHGCPPEHKRCTDPSVNSDFELVARNEEPQSGKRTNETRSISPF